VPPQFGKLDGQRSYAPGSTDDHSGLAALYLQGVINSLNCRQARGRNRSRLSHREPCGKRCYFFRLDRHVLGIESALGIRKAVSVDGFTNFKPADARAQGGNFAGAVCSQDQREVGFSTRIPRPGSHLCVPATHSSCIQRNQHFAVIDRRCWQFMESKDFRSAKPVNRCGVHGFRNFGARRLLFAPMFLCVYTHQASLISKVVHAGRPQDKACTFFAKHQSCGSTLDLFHRAMSQVSTCPTSTDVLLIGEACAGLPMDAGRLRIESRLRRCVSKRRLTLNRWKL
jgi:hypothetical protein